MRKILLLVVIFLAQPVSAGELFSFDKNAVIFNALNHIKLRHSDLAKVELSPRNPFPFLEKTGELFVSVTFSYKADNSLGVLYVCAKINENGELLKIQRDIKPKKGLFDNPMPAYEGCW